MEPVQPECRSCGTPRPDPALLDWVLDRTDGVPSWLCPDCVRRHVRDIEARLPYDWW